MKGLEFRQPDFNHRAPHAIPKDSFLSSFYRGRERRLSVKNMYEDFLITNEVECFSNSIGDYVKASNLLFFYGMLVCTDPEKLVEPWACELVYIEEACSSFP